MRRDLRMFLCGLGVAVAAMGCRGPTGGQALGPNAFPQAAASQVSRNPFTKEGRANKAADRRAEAPPDWRTLQAMMPQDTISLARPLTPGADLYVKAAQLYEVRGEIPQAFDQYQKALALDSTDLNALVGLARLHDRSDQPAEALKVYAQAVEYHPANSTVFNDIGLCYSKQERWSEALTNLDKAVNLQPKNPLYRNNVAKVLIVNGRSDAAYQHLAAVLAPADSHYNVGFMAHELGDVASAKRHLAMAVKASPEFVEASDLLAQITTPKNGSPQPQNMGSDLAGASRQEFLPQLGGPQFDAPQLDQRQLDGPQLQGPQLQGPQLQAPQLQAPQLQAPQLQASQLQSPQLTGSRYGPVDTNSTL